MIDLGLNQYKIKEIKYELKEGKTVIFKLNYCNLEDVEIVEEEEKQETKKQFEDRKTREMIDASKNMFSSYRTKSQNRKIKSLQEIGNIISENELFVDDELTTQEKSKKLIEKDAKQDAKVIKERVENAIGTNEPLSVELANAPDERAFNEVAWTNKRNLRLSDSNVPDEIKKVWEDDLNKKEENKE